MIRPRKGNASELASPIITFYRFCRSFVEALEDLRAHAYYRLINPNWYLFESEIFGSVPYLIGTDQENQKFVQKQAFEEPKVQKSPVIQGFLLSTNN